MLLPRAVGPALSVAGLARRRTPTRRLHTALAILLVAAAIVALPPLAPAADWQRTFGVTFVALLLAALPYVLLGSLLSGVIAVLLPDAFLARWSRRLGPFAVPGTVLLAPLFPVCECGSVSVARALMRKGLPPAQAVAYLLAAPLVNPTVALATATALGADMAVARCIGGAVIATGVGLATLLIAPARWLRPVGADACADDHDHGDDHGHAHAAPSWRQRGRQLIDHVADDFAEMSLFLLVGVALAAAIKASALGDGFADASAGELSGPPTLMATAFIMSLCAEADAFVAASFTAASPAAILAFLIFGPMVDLKLLLMYRLAFRSWYVAALALVIALATLALVPLLTRWLA